MHHSHLMSSAGSVVQPAFLEVRRVRERQRALWPTNYFPGKEEVGIMQDNVFGNNNEYL